jgi:hypothetical protein
MARRFASPRGPKGKPLAAPASWSPRPIDGTGETVACASPKAPGRWSVKVPGAALDCSHPRSRRACAARPAVRISRRGLAGGYRRRRPGRSRAVLSSGTKRDGPGWERPRFIEAAWRQAHPVSLVVGAGQARRAALRSADPGRCHGFQRRCSGLSWPPPGWSVGRVSLLRWKGGLLLDAARAWLVQEKNEKVARPGGHRAAPAPYFGGPSLASKPAITSSRWTMCSR